MPFSELPTASIIVVVFFSFLVTILELHAVVKSKVTWMRWIALFAKIGAVFNVLGMGFLLVFLGVVATVPREKRCGDVEDCPYDAIELLNGIWTLFNSAVYLYYAVCAVRFYTELKEDTAITGVYPIYLPVGSDEV
ncbi:hypothetical protein HKX48_008594 [Thoreauomyces humboldtii]|nr:hypothetical protein HKX48_008594 [Thoreauomyces humboldtii]